MKWADVPTRTSIRAARIVTPDRIVEVRVAEGYTGSRKPTRWLASRWKGRPSPFEPPFEPPSKWESEVVTYAGRNYERALTEFDARISAARASGADVVVATTMREVWDSQDFAEPPGKAARESEVRPI